MLDSTLSQQKKKTLHEVRGNMGAILWLRNKAHTMAPYNSELVRSRNIAMYIYQRCAEFWFLVFNLFISDNSMNVKQLTSLKERIILPHSVNNDILVISTAN